MSIKNLLSFSSGIVPMLPAIGDKVHWVELNSENLPGSVRERGLRYGCNELPRCFAAG
jgi:hypothetical protein